MASSTAPDFTNPLAPQFEQLQRRKAIADAIMSQALAPSQSNGEVVSGHYVGNAAGNSLNKIVGLLAARKLDNQNSQQQSNLYGQYQGNVGAEQQRIAEQYKTDPIGAVAAAQASPFPQIAAWGKALGEKTAGQKDFLDAKGVTANSRVAAAQGGGVSALKPQEDLTPVNGQLVTRDPSTGAPVVVGDLRDKFGPVGALSKDSQGNAVIGQVSDTGKAEFAHPNTFVNVAQMPPNVAAAEKIKSFYGPEGMLTKSKEAALSKQQALLGLDQAQQALDSGILSGPSSQAQQAYSRIMGMLGHQPNAEELANTQQFKQNMIRAVGQLGHELAGSRVPVYDEQLAQRASGADPTLTVPELQRAIKIAKLGVVNSLQQHNALVDQVAQDPELTKDSDPFRVQIPDTNLGDFTRGKDGFYRLKDVGQVPAGSTNQQPPTVPKFLQGKLPPGAKYLGTSPPQGFDPANPQGPFPGVGNPNIVPAGQ